MFRPLLSLAVFKWKLGASVLVLLAFSCLSAFCQYAPDCVTARCDGKQSTVVYCIAHHQSMTINYSVVGVRSDLYRSVDAQGLAHSSKNGKHLNMKQQFNNNNIPLHLPSRTISRLSTSTSSPGSSRIRSHFKYFE